MSSSSRPVTASGTTPKATPALDVALWQPSPVVSRRRLQYFGAACGGVLALGALVGTASSVFDKHYGDPIVSISLEAPAAAAPAPPVGAPPADAPTVGRTRGETATVAQPERASEMVAEATLEIQNFAGILMLLMVPVILVKVLRSFYDRY